MPNTTGFVWFASDYAHQFLSKLSSNHAVNDKVEARVEDIEKEAEFENDVGSRRTRKLS